MSVNILWFIVLTLYPSNTVFIGIDHDECVNSNAKVYQIVIQKYTTFEAAKIQKAGYTL